MSMSLLISMDSGESDIVAHTLRRVGDKFDLVFIAHEEGVEAGELAEIILAAEGRIQLVSLPLIEGNPPEFRRRASFLGRSISALSKAAEDSDLAQSDKLVFLTGGTALIHCYGIEAIVNGMDKRGVGLACAVAIGTDVNLDTLSDEQIERGERGGRMQSYDCKDFRPELFVVDKSVIALATSFYYSVWTHRDYFKSIEQWLGECFRVNSFVFSDTAFGFTDGVIYDIRK